MGKFDGILICTDLDGTLLNSKREVSKENRNAIEYFKREGGHFTFVTGRMHYYANNAYRNVNPNAPVGCNNGGAVYDFVEHRYLRVQTMDACVSELLVDIDRELPQIGFILCGLETPYFCKHNAVTLKVLKNLNLTDQSCDFRHPNEPIAKILTGINTEEDAEQIARFVKKHPLAEHFSFVRSERTLFEILPKDTHKGLAVLGIAEHLGIDPARTVAIGDYDNDVGMLRTAGVGIAVANASPLALEAASYVTVSNNEHPIAHIVRNIEDGVYPL